ncbi:MAG: hypothetical protein P4L22_06415 [Candidatus Babeliales bacterium]|nr:hypothetical protein [Candidatus Babeliales bacterium]
MNKFILKLLCAFSIFSATNVTYCESSNILRDGILIGFGTGLLIDVLKQPILAVALPSLAVLALSYKNETGFKISSQKIAVSLVITAITSTIFHKKKNSHKPGCSGSCCKPKTKKQSN